MEDQMPEYEFLYIVRIVGIKAANHAESMERDVKITVTVDGEPWPISKPEWDRTYEYDGNRVTTWEQNGPEEGETKEVKDDEDE
jgi:hypothetical protein